MTYFENFKNYLSEKSDTLRNVGLGFLTAATILTTTACDEINNNSNENEADIFGDFSFGFIEETTSEDQSNYSDSSNNDNPPSEEEISRDENGNTIYALKTFHESKELVKIISDTIPFCGLDDHQLKLLNSSTLNYITFGKDGNFNEELGISVGKSLNDSNLSVYYLSFDFINEEFSGIIINVKVPHNNPYLQELLQKTGYDNNLADFKLTAEDMKDFTADDYALLHNLMNSMYNFMYEEYAPYME